MNIKQSFSTAKTILIWSAAGLWLTCAQPFSLKEVIDGPDGKALTVSLPATNLEINETVAIETSGGIPPYSYSVTSGSGSFTKNLFTAPTSPGTTRVRIADQAGNFKEVEFTVKDSYTSPPPSGNVDYFVSAPPVGGIGVLVGSPVASAFSITNQGTEGGVSIVRWWAYISSDQVFDSGDTLADSGSFAALPSNATAASIPVDSGTWSSVGNWYLLVRVQADDEVDTTNNLAYSAPFYVRAASGVDYVVSDVSRNFPIVAALTSVSESFTVKNIGATSGTQDIVWTAYASLDTVPSSGEEIGSGTIPGGLAAGMSHTGVAIIPAAWPSAGGNYYHIVKSDANDEPNLGDYAYNSGTFSVNRPPDYVIVSAQLKAMSDGGNVGETLSSAGGSAPSFYIKEQAGNMGLKTIDWKVYASSDTVIGTGDALVASGSIAPLAGGATTASPIQFDGTLPLTPGAQYYLIQIASADDSDQSNNTLISPLTYYWKTSGNVEVDTTQDDTVGNQAEEYYIKLNPSDTVTINAAMDILNYSDLFRVYTGPSTASLDIDLKWSTGTDALDFYLSKNVTQHTAESVTTAADSEPGTVPLSAPVDSSTAYLIQVLSKLAGNEGKPYTVTISAH